MYQHAVGLFEEKKYRDVVSLCDEAERSGKYDANIVAVHSASLLKLNRPVEVVSLLESMLYYFPNDARLHMNLGTAYAASFRRQESKYEYELARKLDPAMVGQKVTRMTIIRILVATVAFVVFFVAIIFWPHTRWLLVGLNAAMVVVSAIVLVGAVKGRVRQRLLAPSLMLGFWILLLILSILIPVHR